MRVDETFDCIVIGGGASGMMAAAVAAMHGKRVLILEKNKYLGEKLKISGGGRCNITNATLDIHKMLANYGDAKDFLHTPFAQFGVQSTFDFFEQAALPLVVQARSRAFPHTEKALDVFLALENILKKNKVVVASNCAVLGLNVKDGQVTGVRTRDREYVATQYILATGGVSHPETGSTGDGFRWLKALGHTIKEPTPSIVPLAVKERWVHALAGTSLSFMKITFSQSSKKGFSKKGKILFTHFGLSGPLILNAALQVGDMLHNGSVDVKIDMYPDTDHGALEKKILKVFDAEKNKMFKNVCEAFVSDGMRDAVLTLIPFDGETKVHSVSKESRKALVQLLKALPCTVTGLMGYDRAVIADGGLDMREIDVKTMSSKLYSNLKITGDLLHINRPSGGFSLQLCWTTGYVAGKSV